MKNVAICIQARLSSSRLPGKVLMPILNKPMLQLQIDRLRAMSNITVIVVTSEEESDDSIEHLCQQHKVQCYRGSLVNVVKRFYDLAIKFGLDAIIRVGGDDPLISPQCCEQLNDLYQKNDNVDFIYGSHKEGWMYGTAAELITTITLSKILENTSEAFDLEHTTPYIFSHPEQFSIISCGPDPELIRPDYFVSVDHRVDFDLVTKVFEHFIKVDSLNFSYKALCCFLDRHPELLAMNQNMGHGFDR